MSAILEFSTTEQPGVEQIGSKAHALIRMAQAGYPVPPGFVLTVSFFAPWMEALQAAPEWAALAHTGPEGLGALAGALKERCARLDLSPAQKAALDQALQSFGDPDAAGIFAVRSSSPEEDLAGSSFAGAYESTLGVTPEGLEAAIRHSFASSFDARIFLYKIQHGMQISRPRIAVIVQQQIDAQSAGVAFSLNPLNNCYDEAVINANYGLGESVVSGEVDPDVFVVDKVTGEILDTRIGRKERLVALAPGGGTVRSEQAPSTNPCLTPGQVGQIVHLLIQIEKDSRAPVDIEWAFAAGALCLLQARPITTYLPLPQEMVTAPGEPKRLYADSTLIEQGVQEPLSVLGTDFLRYVLNTMTGPMGGSADSVEGGAFTAGGRYYMNLSKTMQIAGPAGGLAPGSIGDESVMGILETIDIDQYLPARPSPLEMIKRLSGPLKMTPKMLPVLKALRDPEWILGAYQQALPGQLQRIENVLDRPLSLHELAGQLTGALDFFFYEYGLPMVFAAQIAQQRIKRIFAEDGEQGKAHLLSLGASLPGNKTSEMGALMSELASTETIREHDDAASFLAGLEGGSLDPEFLSLWDRFIAEFGHRCPKEIDVATPRPGEDPAGLFEQLKAMSAAQAIDPDAANIFEEARSKREAAYAELYQLAQKKGKRQARTLQRLYKTWLTLGGYRETPKHYVICVVNLFRKRALEVGATLVAAGRLDEAGQIFDLRIKDIDRALTDPAVDLRAMAAENTVLIDKIKRSPHVARIIDSRGKIYFPPRKPARAGELAGVPISAGVVRGKVKILHTADGKHLLPGEILVTRATDPGWTPLFINAGGVILEIGGALQHGAVVAREYGLPCVSGIDRATELLKDGQMVEVDGNNGIIRILDGDIPEFAGGTDAQNTVQPQAEALRQKYKAKQKRQQTLLRLIPLLLLPFMVLCIAVIGFMGINLLTGHSFSESLVRLQELWQTAAPLLIRITNVIGITMILGALWKNRSKLARLIGKGRR